MTINGYYIGSGQNIKRGLCFSKMYTNQFLYCTLYQFQKFKLCLIGKRGHRFQPSVSGCISSGSRSGNVPNELVLRTGPPFLDNHYHQSIMVINSNVSTLSMYISVLYTASLFKRELVQCIEKVNYNSEEY